MFVLVPWGFSAKPKVALRIDTSSIPPPPELILVAPESALVLPDRIESFMVAPESILVPPESILVPSETILAVPELTLVPSESTLMAPGRLTRDSRVVSLEIPEFLAIFS